MGKLLKSAELFKLLEETDRDLAAAVQQGGCPLCGGRLDVSDHPRKPRGGPTSWDRRLNLCCRRCRKRRLPPSVRFLGPRVYVGVVVTLAAAMLNGLSGWRVACLSRELGVDRRTLKRWREWWRAVFVRSAFWKEARGGFARPVAETTMPLGLVESFGAQDAEGMVRLLRFLAPITVGTRGVGLGK